MTQPAPKKSQTESTLPGSNKGRKKKKKGIRFTKKPVKKRRGQMGKGKKKKSNRMTELAANSKLSPEISLAQQQPNNSRKVVASIEDILPDLKPTRPVTTPRMMTKRLSSETARAAQVVRAVTAAEEAFTCLECGQRFEDFASLASHKAAEKKGRRGLGMVESSTKYKEGSSPRIAKSATYNHEDYSDFISKAIRQVSKRYLSIMNVQSWPFRTSKAMFSLLLCYADLFINLEEASKQIHLRMSPESLYLLQMASSVIVRLIMTHLFSN